VRRDVASGFSRTIRSTRFAVQPLQFPPGMPNGSGGELMRGVLLALAVAFALTAVPTRSVAASTGIAISSTPTVYALQTPVPDKTIDININQGGGGYRWWRNPLWIGIGAL